MSRRTVPENRLLAVLPVGGRRAFLADCEQVDLAFAQVLCETGDRIQSVYLPLGGFISLVTTLNDSERLEIGIVGDEGMLGVSLILGVNVSSQHAVVQGAGTALKIGAAAFRNHCGQNAQLRLRLNRYVHVLMMQLEQMTVCSRYHGVEARLARWLLMTRDRAHSERFHLTHEFLAYMLGVRRVSITQAATALHRRALIGYSRGHIIILDGVGLEQASCACYAHDKQVYERTLGSLL